MTNEIMMAYFPVEDEARKVYETLDVIVETTKPRYVPASVQNGNAWLVEVDLSETPHRDTRVVTPELREHIIDLVLQHGGQVRTPS